MCATGSTSAGDKCFGAPDNCGGHQGAYAANYQHVQQENETVTIHEADLREAAVELLESHTFVACAGVLQVDEAMAV